MTVDEVDCDACGDTGFLHGLPEFGRCYCLPELPPETTDAPRSDAGNDEEDDPDATPLAVEPGGAEADG